MTPTDQPLLSVRSTADLIAVVPYLLGFHPTESVVVVAMRGKRVVFAARGDLPAPGTTSQDPAAAESREAAGYIAAVVGRQRVENATIIGYGPAVRVTPAVDAVTAALRGTGVPVRDALRVTDGRYWSYVCDNPECCPPEGVPFDQVGSPIAAAATFAGQVALPDRASLAQQVAPVEGLIRESMREATERAAVRLAGLLEEEAQVDPLGRRALRAAGESAVRTAVERYQAGGGLTDDELAWLTLLLTHLPVRDYAWERTDADDWQLTLWTDVLRRAESELVAAPASLLAFAAWRAGQGALAMMALDRALAARPDYSMALLLAEVLQNGIPPTTLDGWPASLRDGSDRGPDHDGVRPDGVRERSGRKRADGIRRAGRQARRRNAG